MLLRHARPLEARGVARPALGQEQAQRHRHGHLAARQRHGYERLAVGVLAQRRRISGCDPDRVLSLPGQRRVVDHEVGVGPADQPVGLAHELRFQGLGIPDAGRDEMVQAVVAAHPEAMRHGLHALALAGADQAGDVERAHSASCGVRQAAQENGSSQRARSSCQPASSPAIAPLPFAAVQEEPLQGQPVPVSLPK